MTESDAASASTAAEPPEECSTERHQLKRSTLPQAPAALATFAVPSALATTAAAVTFAHEHIRAIVVALLVQSSLQLLPALFLLFGSPMVVMFADSLGKSGNPVAERNKFLAFAMTSAAVILAALSFLITSLLGLYAGWNVLGRPEGAAHIISTLVRLHETPSGEVPHHDSIFCSGRGRTLCRLVLVTELRGTRGCRVWAAQLLAPGR